MLKYYKIFCANSFRIKTGSKLRHFHFPDDRLEHHCQMKERQETLFSPNSTEGEAVKELEDAVERYAKDNLLVVRVRKSSAL